MNHFVKQLLSVGIGLLRSVLSNPKNLNVSKRAKIALPESHQNSFWSRSTIRKLELDLPVLKKAQIQFVTVLIAGRDCHQFTNGIARRMRTPWLSRKRVGSVFL